MKSISRPIYNPVEVYKICSDSIQDPADRIKFEETVDDFQYWAKIYESKAYACELFSLEPVLGNNDTVIFGAVTKEEMGGLYSYCMVQGKSGRQVYDKIKLSAQEKCPYCGGIGLARNLDHYLPKSRFPQFSVLPDNLLPCCRDCNSESKHTSYATTLEEQVIHPYFDGSHFFDEQWVKARLCRDEPYFIYYYVEPPTHWSESDKSRVQTHFQCFDLSYRYGTQAAEELSTLIDKRRMFMKDFTASQFSDYLQSIGNSPSLFPNHWKRIMYQALALDTWFCGKAC